MFPHPKRHVIVVESKTQQLEIPGPEFLVFPTCSEEEALLVVLSHAQARGASVGVPQECITGKKAEGAAMNPRVHSGCFLLGLLALLQSFTPHQKKKKKVHEKKGQS